MLGFLRFIAIFFLVLLGLGLIARILLRFFLYRLAKKMNSDERFNDQKQEPSFTKNHQEKDKKISRDTGEYIDFEEINE